MKAVAKLKSCPMSARKMRLVVDNIRGKNVDEALNVLKFTKQEASEWVEKLLLSAISNWENKVDMAYNADDYGLVVSEVFVDQAGSLKRFRPAPQGRAHRIRKHMNHVTLVVENTVAIDEDSSEEE
jgi:large subunit ribosomal protein L22